MKRISIGNDIIALKSINATKTRQQNFYSKFLTEDEVELYKKNNFSVLPFEKFVWLCWSIKESVFKFKKRISTDFTFSFKKIQIQQIKLSQHSECLFFKNEFFQKDFLSDKTFYASLTFINSVPFYSYSFIADDFIYTITADKAQRRNIVWGIKKIKDASYNTQSQCVRKFALQKMGEILNVNELEVLKSESGYPFVKQYSKIPVSFTHHYHFIGYAFLVEQVA
jgi:phosphopantetheine--protein transferase-like protein